MKQNYSERPQETWLEVLNKVPGGTCIVHFNEKITEETGTSPDGESCQIYSAEHYEMRVSYREGLENSIIGNRAAWLKAAMESNGVAKPKTELEILQDSIDLLKEDNKNLNSTVDLLTTAILEGGI